MLIEKQIASLEESLPAGYRKTTINSRKGIKIMDGQPRKGPGPRRQGEPRKESTNRMEQEFLGRKDDPFRRLSAMLPRERFDGPQQPHLAEQSRRPPDRRNSESDVDRRRQTVTDNSVPGDKYSTLLAALKDTSGPNRPTCRTLENQ